MASVCGLQMRLLLLLPVIALACQSDRNLQIISNSLGSMEAHSIISDIPLVKISPEGIFKYILIQGHLSENNKEKTVNFIRGDKNLEYHADNFRQFSEELKAKGFEIKGKNIDNGRFEAIKGKTKLVLKCPGGGRIEHNYNGNKCFVYGYSKSYGRVDHTIAQKLISASLNYPLNEIKTSKEGY